MLKVATMTSESIYNKEHRMNTFDILELAELVKELVDNPTLLHGEDSVVLSSLEADLHQLGFLINVELQDRNEEVLDRDNDLWRQYD